MQSIYISCIIISRKKATGLTDDLFDLLYMKDLLGVNKELLRNNFLNIIFERFLSQYSKPVS